MTSKRVFPRHPVQKVVKIIAEQKQLGFIINLSRGGMLISSEYQLNPKQRYRFKLILPKEAGEQSVVYLDGICRWVNYDQDFSHYNVGVKFETVPADFSQLLKNVTQGNKRKPIQIATTRKFPPSKKF